MKALPIRWAHPAEEAFDTLLDFIGLEIPEASRRLLKQVHEALGAASQDPEMYRTVPELGHTYREIVSVRPFRVVYQIVGRELRVVAVLRTEQDFDPSRYLDTP